MKICMIGGTGLLGCEAAKQMIAKGHQVSTVALPPLPEGAPIPEEMEIIFKDINKASDAELEDWLRGADAFVFAAGVDERVEFPHPVEEYYHKYNIAPLERIFPICKKVGVKHATVLGSYFAYLSKQHPERTDLRKKNPYFRSRLAQEKFCEDSCTDDFTVDVLELPYIFGTQPGRKPVWVILIEQIKMMDKWPFTMYPAGGTAMLTCRQVGEVICGSATRTDAKGFNAFPIAMYNMKWKPFMKIVYNARGMGADRTIISVPPIAMKFGVIKMYKHYKDNGIEPGMSPFSVADVMDLDIFIDDYYAKMLGATPDDIEAAIFDSIKISEAAYNGTLKLLEMKGE